MLDNHCGTQSQAPDRQAVHGVCTTGVALPLALQLTNGLDRDDRENVAIQKAPFIPVVLNAVVVLPAPSLAACWLEANPVLVQSEAGTECCSSHVHDKNNGRRKMVKQHAKLARAAVHSVQQDQPPAKYSAVQSGGWKHVLTPLTCVLTLVQPTTRCQTGRRWLCTPNR